MSEPLATPLGAQAGAEIKQKQSLDGIKAAAIKAGRSLERKDILASLGATTLEELSMLAAVRQEHNAEHEADLERQEGRWRVIERKHGLFRLWQGIALGASLGAIAAGVATYVVIDGGQKAAFDAATEAAARNVVTGYALQRSREPGEDAVRDEENAQNPVN